MSKYKKYTTGGGINPFWILEQQKKNGIKDHYNPFKDSGINISVNININDDGLNGSLNFSKSKAPDNDLKLAIKRTKRS